MTKRNNKGFSIVDSIIAVAVLTILITPILYQVIHTMNTSRQAKERQYVLDNAQYVMTFFQSTKDEGLYKVDPADPTLGIVEDDLTASDSKIDVLASDSEEVYCDLYLLKKDPSTGDFSAELVDDHDIEISDPNHDSKTLKYGVDCYLLSTVPLGKNNNTYERTVVVDDLSSKLINIKDADGSIKYDIAYNVDSDSNEYGLEAGDVENFVNAGWELTNEGSLVKYLDITVGTKTYSVIKDAIVVEHGKYYREDNTVIDTRYSDPNSMEMSFMQNLDADKVALIQGNATSFDKQAEKDFFNLRMSYLKEENPEQYFQEITTKTGETGFNGVDQAKKATRISIKKTTDFSGKECYQVDCDVFYFCPIKVTTVTHNETLNYNVYSKKFYTTNKSPDIYFIYEPLVTNSGDTAPDFRYADTDTIFVYNDVESKNSKLYVIKPEWDQLSVKYDRNDLGNNAVDPETGKPIYNEETKYQAPKDDVFWTKDYRGRLKPVEIEFAWIAAPYDDGEGGTNTPLRVFTNLRTEKKFPDATERDAALSDDQKYLDRYNGGNLRPYSSNIIESLYTYGADVFIADSHGSAGTARTYNGDSSLNSDPSDDLGDSKKDYIRSVIDDVSSKDRLNTVTVTFKKVGSGDDEKPIARYSGAKEVN